MPTHQFPSDDDDDDDDDDEVESEGRVGDIGHGDSPDDDQS